MVLLPGVIVIPNSLAARNNWCTSSVSSTEPRDIRWPYLAVTLSGSVRTFVAAFAELMVFAGGYWSNVIDSRRIPTDVVDVKCNHQY